MPTHPFDQIASRFASRRLSRRAALAQAGLGVTAVAAIPLLATAQEATPVGFDVLDADRRDFLFVQTFASGSLAPSDEEGGLYTLVLEQSPGHTLYFSDRPERIVGTVPMEQFLDGLGFTPANPPNAALVAEREDGGEEIIVLELLNPQYDEAARTLTYDVRILADDEQLDMTLDHRLSTTDHEGATFGASSLFIDDCPTYHAICHRENQAPIDYGCQSFCWESYAGSCVPCQSIQNQCCADQPSGQCDVTYGANGC